MVRATNLGYPRIGPERELKKALERYWTDRSDEVTLLEEARALRRTNWQLQQELRIEHIPSNDFSLYDQVLDTAAMVGAVPARYGWTPGEPVDLDTYFAMARGIQEKELGQADAAPAMEMTKWFDTNYHYIVPEFTADQQFEFASTKPIDEFNEATALGIHTRPVLLGPVSFLLLGKPIDDVEPLMLLPDLLPVYAEVLRELADAGADWIQMDEPCLVLDLEPAAHDAYVAAYERLAVAVPDLNLLLTTYFGDLRDNLDLVLDLPVAGIHLDLVRAPEQLADALSALPGGRVLSLGVVDGRNIWRTDLDTALQLLQTAVAALGTDRVLVGPSCSLLHTPIDLEQEPDLDEERKNWLAFAKQKLQEIAVLVRGINEGEAAIAAELEASRAAQESRRTSSRIHSPTVQERSAAVTDAMLARDSVYDTRRDAQRGRLDLPPLPTTTIGSFPQTREVRAARAAYKSGKTDRQEYEAFIEEQIEQAIRFQEEIGLDVLVHGEFERTDMVEHFGQRFTGVAFTRNGWVQSYGSRCVRPPIIYGDVVRPEPMTVRWSTYAQSLTDRPVKGMLTGPVTILQWSFVRDDQPRSETCKQIALAIRDEVLDLEDAGITAIQIDEPALREGLPLRRADWDEYLEWAVDCFRLASAGVRDETQIHTHMCYSEFNDIIGAITRMDADVISIESSRSRMELLDAFVDFDYPNEIGPGVYDIHSPRVPSTEEMETLLHKALDVLAPEQLWVNPDCGLKTRRWEEVKPALRNMVDAARAVRESLTVKA